jgi:hypothetical protein
MRFLFKYGSEICTRFVEEIRKMVLKEVKPRPVVSERVSTLVAKELINAQIPEASARVRLRAIVKQEVDGLGLKNKDKEILRTLFKGKEARASDFRAFGLKTIQDFAGNYLSTFYQQHLLSRRQEGTAVYYSLRGTAALAAKYGLL